MKHGWPRKQTLFLLVTSLLLPGLAAWAEAQSHRGARAGGGHRAAPGAHHARATSHRPAHHRRPAPRRPQLPAGFGSAANVRPGFYQQLSAPQTHHHSHPGAAVVPVYVYLDPYYTQPFHPEATQVAPREIPAPEPAPAQAPIYIVTPPVAPPAAAPAPAPAEPPPPPAPRSTEPGEVRFSILPADAEVFLDDDYLGTGAELAALEESLRYLPGVHVLEVTHPDYRPQRLVFGVSSNDSAHVLIDLSIDRVGRRSRIK